MASIQTCPTTCSSEETKRVSTRSMTKRPGTKLEKHWSENSMAMWLAETVECKKQGQDVEA